MGFSVYEGKLSYKYIFNYPIIMQRYVCYAIETNNLQLSHSIVTVTVIILELRLISPSLYTHHSILR